MPTQKAYVGADSTAGNSNNYVRYSNSLPIPGAAQVQGASVGLRPLACWDCGFESRRGHGCLSLVSVVCCQVEVSATSRSLVQRNPTDCGVSECNREASTMRRPIRRSYVIK